MDHPDRLLGRLTAKEWQEWQLYDEQEPFGYQFLNLFMGKVCAMLAEVNRDPKKRTSSYKPHDFIHRPLTEAEKESGVIGDYKGLNK